MTTDMGTDLRELTPKQVLEENKKLLLKKDNFLIFRFGWSSSLIVPYKDGMEIVKYLVNAENFEDTRSDNLRIKPLGSDDIHIKPLSEELYLRYKARYLLKGDGDAQ